MTAGNRIAVITDEMFGTMFLVALYSAVLPKLPWGPATDYEGCIESENSMIMFRIEDRLEYTTKGKTLLVQSEALKAVYTCAMSGFDPRLCDDWGKAVNEVSELLVREIPSGSRYVAFRCLRFNGNSVTIVLFVEEKQ